MREILSGSVFDDFEDLFKPFDKNARSMRTDIKENDKQYEFDIDMPGFKKDEISIDLNEGYLTISAKKNVKQEEKEEKGVYLKRERYFSAGRSYYIGDKVLQDKIKAKYEDGVLNIIVPKEQPKELPKHKIEID